MSHELGVQVDFDLHKPTLFVGLGGAGATVVNRISAIMGRRDDWREIHNIYQFFVLDTDRTMIDDCPHVPMAHKFIISNFDKGAYVEDKRGHLSQAKTEADPRVVQWVHDWYNFRSTQGMGAGQIRIESRLSLYNAIESTDLIKRIEDAISQTIHVANTKVDTRVKSMNVFVYFSAAGGTGSGACLTIAALLRHIVMQFGWSAKIIGVCMLSTLFLPIIRNPRQRDDILANGYATVKEIEHLMKIKVTADDPSRRASREFVYHPFIQSTEVFDSPFDFVYMIDTPSHLYVGPHFRDVVADAVYLQTFSPIFAKRDSDYDNYEKNQKRLARGIYTVHYGSFGCSLLVLPDKDLLQYCATRQTLDIFKRYLSGSFVSSDNQSFNPENELGFHLEDPIRQDQIRDACFCKFIDHETMLENKQRGRRKGKFSLLKEKIGATIELTFDRMLNIETRCADKLTRKDGKETDALRTLIDDTHRFEPWFQSEPLKDVWQMEPKGADPKAVANKERAHKFFGLRAIWEQAFTDELHQKIGAIYTLYPRVSIKDHISRDGDRSFYRRMVQEEVAKLLRDVIKRLANIDRDLEHLREGYAQRFSGTHFISSMLSEENIDIYEQRYFAMALAKEISARKKATELLKAEYNPEELRKNLDCFLENNQENLEMLYKEAEKDLKEVVLEKLPGYRDSEEESFKSAWLEHFAAPLNKLATALENWQRYFFLHYTYDMALLSVEKYLTIIREFYNNSAFPIKALSDQCTKLLDDAGEQANEYVVDEEVLRDLSGKRLWESYYNLMVSGKSGEHEVEQVMAIISSVFSSEIYQNNYDRATAIQERLVQQCRDKLAPLIVGEYSSGTQRRGLLIQEGLELEAQFKFVEYLKANGFWKDWEAVYLQHLELGRAAAEIPANVKALRERMDHFSRNYLEIKLQKCLRNSQILANINTNDGDVVEFSCKQAMMAYDERLYGRPDADHVGLAFPSIVAKMSPETSPVQWPMSNIVVFYTAVLGVPLFCFRNIIGQCKEAYNRRVSERQWDKPYLGRQYPLHIDKNWEPDDPSVDRSNLPLALDPDEAVDQRTKSSKDMMQFFEMFIRLVHAGQILYDAEHQKYLVPTGKLGNKGKDVILGRSPREAVIALLSTIPVHGIIRDYCSSIPPLTRPKIVEYRDAFAAQTQVDLWHDEKLDAELASTLDLLDDLLRYHDESEAEDRRKAKRAHFGGSMQET